MEADDRRDRPRHVARAGDLRPQSGKFAVALMVVSGMAWGQAEVPLEFEVVSIKPSPPVLQGNSPRFFGCRGGPGSADPGQITCSQEPATALVKLAYKTLLERRKASGDPPRFEIIAKVPRGATKEQVQQMWQRFLKDRFQLAVHRATQEMPVYELVVAKSGFKAKERTEGKNDAEPFPYASTPKRDPEGFPIVAPGQAISFFGGEKAYFVAPAGSMKVLAEMLERRLGGSTGEWRPVLDATKLEGEYDLKLWWSRDTDFDNSADGTSLLNALESQLGLKLEPRKSAPVEVLVIDHIERTPTEN